jgi:hypothetical protein
LVREKLELPTSRGTSVEVGKNRRGVVHGCHVSSAPMGARGSVVG